MSCRNVEKENVGSPFKQRRLPDKAESKQSSRGFTRLLSDVTNTIRCDFDEKAAVKIQDDDASALISEWVREQKDSRLAKQITEDLEEEFRLMRKKELSQGEAVAMRIALEERKRLQLEAQAKRENMENDSKMAKDAVDEETEYLLRCDRDDLYAKQLQDEQYAEALQKNEHDEDIMAMVRRREASDADEKIAKQHQEELELEMQLQAAIQEEADWKIAQSFAKTDLNLHKSQKSGQQQQEIEDSQMSHKLATATMRAEHRRKKYVYMMSHFEDKSVADLWHEADPIIEDVMNGICISLLLPNIKKLDVKLGANSAVTLITHCLEYLNNQNINNNLITLGAKRVVTVEVTRMVLPGDKTATIENSHFDIDFEVEGAPVKLTQKELSYEYASESGMLHVYIENVHLETDSGDVGADCKGSSRFTSKVGSRFAKLLSGITKRQT